MNARAKGKRGELEFASLLREQGFDARRGQQFSGGAESPDIVSRMLSWLHIEVKRCERIDMRSWVAQSEADCGGKPWVIFYRWNHGPWFQNGRADLFFGLLRAVLPPNTENFEEEMGKIIEGICERVERRSKSSEENDESATSPLILSPEGGEEAKAEVRAPPQQRPTDLGTATP